MKLVFFNNHKLVYDCQTNFDIETIVTNGDFSLTNFAVDLSGNTIYVINVDTIFDAYRHQDQAGVIIYRHLLDKFSNCQNKLKVVFFSVIELDNLVKLKPENYVLILYPFVHFRFDGKFFENLNVQLNNYKDAWPQLNNASENLLSGWSLEGAIPIDLKTKKLTLIDDQSKEWQTVYDYIFADFSTTKIISNKETILKIINQKKIDIIGSDIIISDLYQIENHVQDWKNRNYIKDISGYKVLKIIRTQKPLIPVIFFTSSNKINNYRGLNHIGIDGYIVKDNAVVASKEQKKQNYIDFKETILHITEEYQACWISSVFEEFKNNYEPLKPEVSVLITEAFKRLKFTLNKYYLDDDSLWKEDNILETNTIINFGKAIEIQHPNVRNLSNQFIYSLRSFSVHKLRSKNINKEDVIVCCVLLANFFMDKRDNYKWYDFKIDAATKNKMKCDDLYFFYHPYIVYCLLINQIKNITDSFRSLLEQRAAMHKIDFYEKIKWWTQEQINYFNATIDIQELNSIINKI